MNLGPETQVILLFGGLCLAGVYGSWRRRSPDGGAFFLAMYRKESSPIWWRNLAGLIPVWTVAALLFTAAALLPRWAGQWLALATIVVAAIAFGLSYRVPAPFLPRWIRREIDMGRVGVARPDKGDWFLFVMVMSVAVIGIPSVILLVLVFHASVGS